ncbi:MAG TPA: hypothetical protein DER01_01000, partial [Phycisphaerales bacterium]|nr:hypothetical protein [Phycisphaerales bacterium]
PLLQACGVILAGILSLVFKFNGSQLPDNHANQTPSIRPYLKCKLPEMLVNRHLLKVENFYIYFFFQRQ